MKAELDKLVAQINKQYGERSAYTLKQIPNYKVISSGSLSVNYALGIGGFPGDKVFEIFGKEGTGKTTLALHIANEFLKADPDKAVAFIDIEHRLEKDWAANFIGDMERVVVFKPDDAEEGVNIYRDAAKSELFSLIVWDSIGGAPTAKGLEKDANTATFGGNSMIITQFAKYAMTLSGKYAFATIGINQERQDMGGYNRPTTPGGDAWKHACTLRIRLVKGKKGDGQVFEKINGEEIQVGYQVFATVVKSSVSPPGRVANYWFYNVPNSLGFGIDHIEEVARLSTLTGVVEKAGAWLKHPNFPNGTIQGLSKLTAYLKEHPELCEQLSKETMALMQSGTVDMSEIVPTVDISDLKFDDDGDSGRVRTIHDIRVASAS